jgi:NAD(P)-dependent dehydrogenase (short-subunit alcohol dehydrogenase family)
MPYPALDLTGKVAVATGSTSGLGRAIAKGLAQAGAHVVASSRRQAQVNETADEIEKLGRRTLRVTSDVGERESLQHLLEATLNEFGQVDILVNAAGMTRRVPTLEASEDDWNCILDTNLTGMLRACQVFAPQMRQRRAGRIINIASLSSFVGFHEVAAYAASKAGVVSLTQTLAIELAPYNVCVNAIAPGVFATPMNHKLIEGTPRGKELLMRTPMKRFGQAEELVGAAIFLASDSASFVTGHVLAVDGGFLASGVNQ